ncbi:MAG: hypothetical protein ABI716_03420 [Candidatus Saccharibacteria bacterium]
MTTTPKSPQEMAAEMLIRPRFDESVLAKKQIHRLDKQAEVISDYLMDIPPYLLPDDQLKPRLVAALETARESGAWDLRRGQRADERLAFALKRRRQSGLNEAETASAVRADLGGSGYLAAIRDIRRQYEQLFLEPTANYIVRHGLDVATEKNQIDRLFERTIDLSTLTPEGKTRLAGDFPTGNFLYHGANTHQLVAILESGALVSSKTLYDRHDKAAPDEQYDPSIGLHSGYEGISWSLNTIDALPGDRFHMAGFIGAPETILGESEQLTIPSRPNPHEVIQLSDSIDAGEFYDAKNQFELYHLPGADGECNSVYSNLLAIEVWKKAKDRPSRAKPLLFQAQAGLLTLPDYKQRLRDLYSVEPDDSIRLSPLLLTVSGSAFPAAAVWMQAAIDTGRFTGSGFAGKEADEIIKYLSTPGHQDIMPFMEQDCQSFGAYLDQVEDAAPGMEVAVERLYFVAPRKDAATWLKLLARSGHQPAGLLLYDDKTVRLENFNMTHLRGDHAELTRQLRRGITPQDGSLTYADLLGLAHDDEIEAGYSRLFNSERGAGQRRAIKQADHKLRLDEAG